MEWNLSTIPRKTCSILLCLDSPSSSIPSPTQIILQRKKVNEGKKREASDLCYPCGRSHNRVIVRTVLSPFPLKVCMHRRSKRTRDSRRVDCHGEFTERVLRNDSYGDWTCATMESRQLMRARVINICVTQPLDLLYDVSSSCHRPAIPLGAWHQ